MQNYRDLITALDAAIAAASTHHRARLQCRPGCSQCCKGFSALPLEAAAMQEALSALAPAIRARVRATAGQETEQCPFLLDDLCAIYPHRPLICRSQGLAIAYIDHEREVIEVSACPINFPADEEYPFSEENLLFMDPFNDQLAAINHDFCDMNGLPPAERILFRTIASLAAPLPKASP